MERTIKKLDSPEKLNSSWDSMADCYFQKREFLNHLQLYNPCGQRYYELYCNNLLVAATMVYTLKIDIFTFANIPSPFKVKIIGLPISVAAPPVIGDSAEFGYLLSRLIELESGLILGLNFTEDYLQNKALNMRTLPTFILKLGFDTLNEFEHSLRHGYRRRIRKIREKFHDISSITTPCSEFTEEHYALYLQIMKKTTTRLETLSSNVFRYLPSNFRLTTYYMDGKMLCWFTVCKDKPVIFFFFGGMNYTLRDQFQSYNNNLLGIVETAIDQKFRILDFGQTAGIAKMRLGGEPSERRMFLYHRNPLIMALLRLSRNLISYSAKPEKSHVFKTSR